MKQGSLTVVGTGIQLVGQVTLGTQAWIKEADVVLFALADPVTAQWLQTLNDNVKQIPYNTDNQRRQETYHEMVDTVLTEVRQGQMVCAIFYGHPGVFVYAGHAAIQQAKAEGYHAQMLPGISAEDCLFADLGLDPAAHGCQSFEATDFLIRNRIFDPHSALILWQIGMVGNLAFFDAEQAVHGLTVLRDELLRTYPADHEVTIYEAAVYPTFPPVIQPHRLADLPTAKVSAISTMYVPAIRQAPLNRDMVARLGMPI